MRAILAGLRVAAVAVVSVDVPIPDARFEMPAAH